VGVRQQWARLGEIGRQRPILRRAYVRYSKSAGGDYGRYRSITGNARRRWSKCNEYTANTTINDASRCVPFVCGLPAILGYLVLNLGKCEIARMPNATENIIKTYSFCGIRRGLCLVLEYLKQREVDKIGRYHGRTTLSSVGMVNQCLLNSALVLLCFFIHAAATRPLHAP
jgi:hypothetical protein